MAEATREFAIAKTMEILRAYVRKIEDAKGYFDCLSPEGRRIVENYDNDVDGQKTLLLKASDNKDFFLGMPDDMVLAYADVCRKLNDRFDLNVKKVYPIERLAADKKGFLGTLWGVLQDEFNEKPSGSEIRNMNAVTQSKTGTETTIFHIGENMEEEKTSYTMSENGKTLLKKLEGCVKNDDGLLVSYNDSNNYATKGYGILICKSPLTDDIIAANPPQTEEQATSDFENKLAEFESIVNNRAAYTYPDGVQTVDTLSLSETKADAIISLTYNSPKTAKKVMDAIRNGKTQDELKTIWMDGNSTDSGLGKRRAAEWKLYSEGTYEENPYD